MARHLPVLFIPATVALFAVAVLARGHGYLQERDFLLHASAPCDPGRDTCFTTQCSEADAECSPEPYAKAVVSARTAPACLEEHSCAAFTCEGRPHCAVTLCSPDVLEPSEQCTPPAAP